MTIYKNKHNAADAFLVNQNKLPAERIRLIHPLPLRTHHLLNYITATALAAVYWRNVF
jgi:hypothetical protein